MAELAFHKKRRSVTRSSLTKLGTELEADSSSPILSENARSLTDKLNALSHDFKTHQLAIIDRTNDEDGLVEEQRVLDDNDDVISELDIRIWRLLSSATTSTTPDAVRIATKQLTLLQTNLDSIKEAMSALDDADDDLECTLEEYKDQASELKGELAKLKMSLLSSEATPHDPVMQDLN